MAINFVFKCRLHQRNRQPAHPWVWLMWAAALLLVVLPARGHAAQVQSETFIMGAGANPDGFDSRWIRLIYSEAFKRMGVPFDFDYATLKRRALLADDGGIGGEPARVYEYGSSHPNLVRVEESVTELNFVLYTANPALHLQSLEELRNSDLLVEYRRGIGLCENTLKQLLPRERIYELPTVEQGVKKLLAGRSDLYCDIDVFVREHMQSPEFKGISKVRKVLDLGTSVPTYPYLHKKYAELAPRLAATLKQMKAEGLIEAYRNQAERELGWVK